VNLDLRNGVALQNLPGKKSFPIDAFLILYLYSFFFSLSLSQSCLNCGLSNRAIRKMEMAITRKELG